MQQSTSCDMQAIRNHYISKKSQALAFLMTVGAKALVLAEVGSGSVSSIQESFDEEEAIKRKMIAEESLRQFQTSFCDKPGIAAMKVGRNGKSRCVELRFKDKDKEYQIVWKSTLKFQKSFKLDDQSKVEMVKTPVSLLKLQNFNRTLELQFINGSDADNCFQFVKQKIFSLQRK